MRVLLGLAAFLVLFGLASAQGVVTIGTIPAVNSAAWPSTAPIYSSWIPITTQWADLTRVPSAVTVQIDSTGSAAGGLLFITSQNPTAAGQTSVTLTLSGTSLLNTNAPAGYFAFALTQPTFDPTSTSNTASIRVQVNGQADWTLSGSGLFGTTVYKRAVKISTLSETASLGGFNDVAVPANVGATISLVPGVLSTAITIEFLMPLTSPISTVTVQIDTNAATVCGATATGTIPCPTDFYSYLVWTPDSNAPPAGSPTAGLAQWTNVPAGTRKLTFQVVANPRITNFPPFVQSLVYQTSNGRYPNLAWFPSQNTSAADGSYVLPQLRLTLSGGEANQYNVPTGPNQYYLFNVINSINQVPIFLENVAVPQILTGLSKTFTYHLAHVINGQTVQYSLLAPPGITVSPATIQFACPQLSGSGAGGCATTQTVTVTVDPNFDVQAYGTVTITAIQTATPYNVVFPRAIPSIQFNIVDRYTDNELIVDPIPTSVAFGQAFTFSVRVRVAPAAGVTLQARFISSEFSFDQSTYSLSAANTGFMVTATAIGNNLMKTLAYANPQAPATPYATGSGISSVFGFITAVWTGQGVRNYLSHGIYDIANENYGTIRFGPARTPFENLPAGGIEIYRNTFSYKSATLLNGGTYAVTTWDAPTGQITVALKNAPTSGGVSLTPIFNCAYVTANPATLSFPAGTNEATFTMTANRDGYYNTAFQAGPCTVNFAMSGESSLLYTQPPPFTLTLPTAPYTFTVNVQGLPTNINGNPRSFAMSVTPNFLPRASVTIQPFWALGSFTPTSQTWSNAETAFTKTFVITESDFIDIASFTTSGALPKVTGASAINFAMTGPDAGYYTIASAAAPTHAFRTVNLPAAPASFPVGTTTMVKVFLSDAPTAGSLVLTPIPNEQGALQFDPPSYTFTAGQATTALFQVTGLNIGAWYTEWELTGTDQYLYTATGLSTTFTVGPRGTLVVNAAAPGGGFFSGFFYGPYSLSVGSATGSYTNAAISATSLTVTPTADDWTFQPPVLTFAANGISTPFNMKYTPGASLKPALDTTGVYDFNTVVEWVVSGDDAWMYAFPGKTTFTVRHRTVVLQDETGTSITTASLTAPAGVPVLMWVVIPEGPVPSGGITVTLSSDNLVFANANGATGASSLDVVFQGDIVRQQVLVSTNFNGAWGNARLAFPDTSNARFSIFTTTSGPDAQHYADAANFPGVFNLVKKLFYFDANALTAGWQNLVAGTSTPPQIPLGQVSQRISVGTTGLVSTDVTLTPVCGHVAAEAFSGAGYSGCPYFAFTPAELTFTAGQQVAYFTMTPRAVAPKGAAVIITWAVTGSDAAAWDIQTAGGTAPVNNVPELLVVRPVPKLTFSPTPAIYVDGKAENLVVTLADPTTDFPPFQLLASASSTGVAIEPDIMQFAPGQALTQTYAINHIRPSQVAPTSHTYTITWSIKYAGATTAIALLPRVVPVDACEVRVVRYAIIPDFPTVLGLEWLKASINLTRAPYGDVALVPHLPNFGAGNINVGANPNSATLYYPNQNQVGIKAPGGRVIFDPPAVTFVAGQIVAPFKVRADRLSDNEALYLRVDWEPVFHAEDVNCYYPFAYTWHIAAASTATMAWALVAALAALLLL